MKTYKEELKLSRNILLPTIEKKATREGYGEGIVWCGDHDENIVLVCADLTDSTKSKDFANKFPKRFVQVGVAEQNLAGIAAGLGLSNKIVYMASYAAFSPMRNFDQIRVSICYSNANVKIVSSHAGLGDGPDGATHTALEDIALMRVLPNMIVLSPADFYEAKKATVAAAKIKGPVYIRLTREPTACFTTEKTPFEIGKAYKLTEGKDVTIVATGPIVYDALLASERVLKDHGIECEVINYPTIKPFDKDTLIASAHKTKKVVSVEEHQVQGGFGSCVAEVLSEELPTQLKIMGVQNTFTESGTYEQLKQKYRVNQGHIEKTIIDFVR